MQCGLVKCRNFMANEGVPQEQKALLEEGSVNTERMKADDMSTVLSFHNDFVNDKTMGKAINNSIIIQCYC